MNRRGFTLIELLAVIVVLGLVLVVTIPSVIGNINNNKLSSLYTLSKEVATWCDRKIVEDKLSTDTEKILTNINNKASAGARLEAAPPPRGFEWCTKVVGDGGNHYRKCINKITGEERVIQLD